MKLLLLALMVAMITVLPSTMYVNASTTVADEDYTEEERESGFYDEEGMS
jgi:hypothetical protein